ncbi:MAG: hypothetical protein HYY16_03475 [Planctomycetes bacterium]|nr:hypothetical protein [Planctomycetota bacterium]
MSVRAVALFGVALLASAVVIHVAVWLLLSLFQRPSFGPIQVPRREGVQRDAGFPDVRRIRQDEERLLSTYDWVDGETGVVRIPIERAMDLLVERGWPLRQNTED